MLSKHTGFTLIEMMVSVTIFSIIMLVSAGSIMAIVEANRKAQSLKSVVNNLNFSIETISRNIRVGTNYRCINRDPPAAVPDSSDEPLDCALSDNGNTLILERQFGNPSTDNDQLVYTFDEDDQAILRGTGLPVNDGDFVRITAEEVKIESMQFVVDGAECNNDALQPRVRMVVQGYAQVGKSRSNFNLETAVTQRFLDLYDPSNPDPCS